MLLHQCQRPRKNLQTACVWCEREYSSTSRRTRGRQRASARWPFVRGTRWTCSRSTGSAAGPTPSSPPASPPPKHSTATSRSASADYSRSSLRFLKRQLKALHTRLTVWQSSSRTRVHAARSTQMDTRPSRHVTNCLRPLRSRRSSSWTRVSGPAGPHAHCTRTLSLRQPHFLLKQPLFLTSFGRTLMV